MKWLPDHLPDANFESSFVLERPAATTRNDKLPGPPQVVATLALAEQFRLQMQRGLVKHFAELADAHGMVRPRVTQIMKLLQLPSPLQDFVRNLGPGLRHRDVTERKLVRLLRLPPAQQLLEARREVPGFSAFLENSAMADRSSPNQA